MRIAKHSLGIAFSAMLLILAGCGAGDVKKGDTAGTATEGEAQPKYEAISIEAMRIDAKVATCKDGDECTYVSVSAPMLTGGKPAIIDDINSYTELQVREALRSRQPEPRGNASLQALADGFIEGYKLFVMEFPDSKEQWYLEIEGEKSILTDEYFTLVLSQNEYVGGSSRLFHAGENL